MSNARTTPNGDYERCSPPSFLTSPSSDAGGNRIQPDSTIPCFMSACDETPRTSGSAQSPHQATATKNPDLPNLSELVLRPDYSQRVGAMAEKIAEAADQAELLALLRKSTRVLGAESAAFVSFVRDDTTVSSCRFMLACEPGWAQRYLELGCIEHDPWMAYAAHHSAPTIASQLIVSAAEAQQVVDLAIGYGFASAALVPVHSGSGQPRVSLLCLGSSRAGYFEDSGFGRLRLGARLIAAELHDWWLVRLQRDFIDRSRITKADIELLRHEYLGHSSKRIAAELRTSPTAINSRFQRMILKLGVANRRMAARLALECGLLLE